MRELSLRFCWLTLWGLSQIAGDPLVKDNYKDTYRGAVVEYHPVRVNGDEVSTVEKNVENYVKFMREAKNQGVDIIVFPENGLLIRTILSFIPDPADGISPCDTPSFNTTETVRKLSCSSKSNKIYSLVNLVEKRNCKEGDKNCPTSGFYTYNTNVVFDRKGVVVARYSKFNLYDEPNRNKTELPEMAVFDTDFGVRFGTFICFDILFPAPALKLIQEHNITDFLYTTYWFSELPFLTASQVQRGWAETNNVNLLASGVNYPSSATFGSGIYNGKFGPLMEIMSEEPLSILLIGDVQKINKNHEKVIEREKKAFAITLPDVDAQGSLPSAEDDADVRPSTEKVADTLPLKEDHIPFFRDHMQLFQSEVIDTKKQFEKKICGEKDFCCYFNLTVDWMISDSNYKLRAVVFNGIRKFGLSFRGGVQTCGVVLCEGPDIMNCTNRVRDLPGSYTFGRIQIEGDFRLSDSFQMATTLVGKDKLQTLPAPAYEFKKIRKEKAMRVSLGLLKPVTNLHAFGIWGRDFKRDMESSGSVAGPVSNLAFLLFVVYLSERKLFS